MLVAAIAVALVLLTDVIVRHIGMERDGRHALSERAALLASIQGNALSVPMWNLDETQVAAALDALAADPDFVSASVTQPDGSVLEQRQAANKVSQPAAPTIDVAHAIRYVSHGEVRTLGTLNLSLSTARLQAALVQALRAQVAAFLLVLAAVLATVTIALREFTLPLEMMATALTRLAAGDRETPIPASEQDDEVGAVARALLVFRDTTFRLVKAEGTYRALFENAALGIYGLDENCILHSGNAALLRISGYPDIAALKAIMQSGRLYIEPGRGAALRRLLREKRCFDAEIAEIRRGDGSRAWISQTARAVRDESGQVLGFAGTLEDVTERLRRQGEQQLRVRAAMESASDAILVVDEAGAPLFANPAFVTCFGAWQDDQGGRLPDGVAQDQTTAAALAATLRDGQAWQGEADVLTLGGRRMPMLVRVSPIRDAQGASFGAVMICTDLSDRRRAEARIQHMAHHDWLTGLPNRVLFRERLNAALRPMDGRTCSPDQVDAAVLCVDLDRFKAVNDTLGHASGDCLLQLVATRLQGLVRAGDTVARVGGDEFILIQLGISAADQALTLAERLIHDLGQPFDLAGREVQIGASVGVALAPLHGSDPDTLLGFADMALYEAKSQGRCRVSLFTPHMNEARRKRGELENDLRHAITEHLLHLGFQPQYDLATGRLVGAEALLRWNDKLRGLVEPGDFIPIAEECGLITVLGDWVLLTACRVAASWPPHLRVAVNVSPAQFLAGDVIETVRCALAETGLAPDRLEIEITEGVFMHDSELTRTALVELKALGVRITLDDFGTGYSSLSYLRRMPLNKIKVDRSFIAALGHDPAAHAVVRSIIGLAKVLGLETNAEGVETQAQADLLRAEGCQEVQGFYYGHPLTAEAFARLDEVAWLSPDLPATHEPQLI